jgi:hypothetical protein
MTERGWRITSNPSYLTEGLFGQIALHIFEVLPKLHQEKIFPDWKITSLVYGNEPDFMVIPGVFDLNYKPKNPTKDIDLKDLRERAISVLGNQWDVLHDVWNAYFRIPLRTVKRADAFGDLNHALGLHYRGMDKNQDFKQTNPVSYDDFLTLINDFISHHEDIDTIFIASDEYPIKKAVKQNYKDKRVVDTGETSFWKSPEKTNTFEKGDHAVLDCLLLSKCKYLVKNQSALSGFAKVLNPKLEAYRIAASKLYADIPYFPDAYIPTLTSDDSNCKVILKKLLENDWAQNKKAWQKFGKPFVAMERHLLKWKVEKHFKWLR